MSPTKEEKERLEELDSTVYAAKDRIEGAFTTGMYGNKFDGLNDMHERTLKVLREYGELLNSHIEVANEQELEDWENVEYRMEEEGFHYCFENYSSFEEIKDSEFHKLRLEYLSAADKLEKYIKEKVHVLRCSK